MNYMEKIKEQIKRENEIEMEILNTLGLDFLLRPVTTFLKECDSFMEDVEESYDSDYNYNRLSHKLDIYKEAIWFMEREFDLDKELLNIMNNAYREIELEFLDKFTMNYYYYPIDDEYSDEDSYWS